MFIAYHKHLFDPKRVVRKATCDPFRVGNFAHILLYTFDAFGISSVYRSSAWQFHQTTKTPGLA